TASWSTNSGRRTSNRVPHQGHLGGPRTRVGTAAGSGNLGGLAVALEATAERLHQGAGSMNVTVPDSVIPSMPVVVWGRRSTAQLQDPTLSIPRQLTDVREKLLPGMVVVAHYWDIESGAKELVERGYGRAHELFDVPVPRDGGLQDLLREAGRPDRPF